MAEIRTRHLLITGNPVDGFTYTLVPEGAEPSAFAEDEGVEADWWIAPVITTDPDLSHLIDEDRENDLKQEYPPDVAAHLARAMEG